jgi:hypothetical protein
MAPNQRAIYYTNLFALLKRNHPGERLNCQIMARNMPVGDSESESFEWTDRTADGLSVLALRALLARLFSDPRQCKIHTLDRKRQRNETVDRLRQRLKTEAFLILFPYC